MSTFRPHGRLPALDQKIQQFLAGMPRSGVRVLISDYDGTLAPFRAERSRAIPYAEVAPLLERLLKETDSRLVIISGRPAKSAARLLRLPGIEIWGCHGLEHLEADGTFSLPAVPQDQLGAIEEATTLLKKEGLEGFAERKFGAIAVHWRGKEALAGHLTRRLLRVWSLLGNTRHLRLVPFDGGIEIAVALANKGNAVQTVLGEIGPDASVAYLGDDTSDEEAFGALQGRALSILVREQYRRSVADAWIRPPEEVAAFLRSWISVCKTAV